MRVIHNITIIEEHTGKMVPISEIDTAYTAQALIIALSHKPTYQVAQMVYLFANLRESSCYLAKLSWMQV
jgi:hypothetical protein